ncbi:hypothetical protein [Breoghania sp. L-A4]|uniref:hypothetical protein n=1 Tax=Breoghania sp. L-A4 TaxID=2304600 RepID=UPI0013C33535|nr:hypothetical protein [Breoghania sp. L-A4]
MQKSSDGSQSKAEEKPDLDKLYKPVGIQAVTAAAYCQKTRDAQKRKVKSGS